MAFDATDGAMERRAYLQRLRELAMERMRADELAVAEPGLVKPVSRRESLRWLGMAAVGVAAGVRPLRALAEGATGVLAERAAGVGSSRYPAPQYGAPSWYAPHEPDEPLTVAVKVTRSRSELGDVKLWQTTWAQVVSEKSKERGMGLISVEAQEGYYEDGWGGGTHALLALADPDAKFAYILRANQSFYVAVGGEMYGCMLGAGVFSMHPSYCRSESDEGKHGRYDGVAGVIAAFTQVSDAEASRKDQEKKSINLEAGLPQAFWIRNDYSGWVQNRIRVAQAKRTGDVLELTVRSDGYQSEAMFTLDLKAQKLLKTKFEGKEWAALAKAYPAHDDGAVMNGAPA